MQQIEAGDIHSNKTYELIYNGSQFVVINLFKNFESSYLDDYIKKTDFAEENKAGIISLSAVKGLIPNATEYKNGTVNLRQINNAIDTKVPNATSDTAGKVMLGTTANTALEGKRLAEILGIEFGGNLQDYGRKEKGKFYYDKVNKGYYECIENNNLTYNDTAKFRAISNKPISDRLEKLFSFENDGILKYSNGLIMQFGKGYAGVSGAPFRNVLNADFKSIYSVIAIHNGSNVDTNIAVYVVGNNEFNAYGEYPIENISIFYLAFGRWK